MFLILFSPSPFFLIAFEDIDAINPTIRQGCYKMGSLFQSDRKWNMSLFYFSGFTFTFACLGVCGRQGSHPHYSRSHSYGFQTQICQMGSPLCIPSSTELRCGVVVQGLVGKETASLGLAHLCRCGICPEPQASLPLIHGA